MHRVAAIAGDAMAGPRDADQPLDVKMQQVARTSVLPRAIRLDNGLALTSRHFLAWALDHKIGLDHIQPGKPMQNAYVETT